MIHKRYQENYGRNTPQTKSSPGLYAPHWRHPRTCTDVTETNAKQLKNPRKSLQRNKIIETAKTHESNINAKCGKHRHVRLIYTFVNTLRFLIRTMHIAHHIPFHTLHSKRYTSHSTASIPLATLHTPHLTLHTLKWTLHNSYFTFHTNNSIRYTAIELWGQRRCRARWRRRNEDQRRCVHAHDALASSRA